MTRRYREVIFIDRDPTDPFKGWGWVEVAIEDVKQYSIPTGYPETYQQALFSPNRRDYPNKGNLPSRGRAGAKTFRVNLDGNLVTIRAQKSLTIHAVCTWIKSWAGPTATVVTPGNRTVSLAGEVTAHATHFVYFILNEDSRAIKIGRAKDLEKRMKALQTSNPAPLRLLRSVQVSSATEAHALEKSLHKRFSALRLGGEWFKADAKLLEYVEEYETN